MKAHFIHALENLRAMLFESAAKAESAVRSAMKAAENNSPAAAAEVILGDREIDDAEILIEEECLKILALHQPVASDLREVIAILKINSELERVGDLAVNIAERVADIASYREKGIEKLDFRDMVTKACGMLTESLDSLAYHNTGLAESVLRADDAVDALHRENYTRVRDAILRHSAEAQYYMDGLTVSRCLERVADIATNIAEDVIYLESGRIVRHCHEGVKNAE